MHNVFYKLQDNDKIAFSRVVSSVRKRSSTVRVVASIDGYARDFTTTSSAIVRRKAFVQAAVTLLLELDADAVELNWMSPGNSGVASGDGLDRITMVQLLQDLRQAVNAASKNIPNRQRELWFRGSLHPNVIDSAYNMLDLCELVDHVTLDPNTAESLENAHAPLRGTPQALPVQIPILSQIFGDVIEPGTGFLCKTLREDGWNYAWDGYGGMPYVTRALQNGQMERISYEDLDSLRLKMDMVEQKRFGGIYIDYVHSD
uniref:GH18 domain-containing protein n=1 Tax=Anopheles merus TaxID=30066 RepID=A0A182V308_ANOME